jgi:integrase/recombinase XerD
MKAGVTMPKQITRQHVDNFLAQLRARGCEDSYIHQHARVIKTFTKFLFREGYIDHEISITMPIMRPKRQLVYNVSEVHQILRACKDERDRAFILFMIDSGLRNAEVRALNWADVNMKNGIVRVVDGKGGKLRSVVVSIQTRRALLKYKSKVLSRPTDPVFQTQYGTRLTESGLISWMRRLSERAEIKILPQALRRTFASLAVKTGINVFQLQALMGHSTLDMTRQYVTMFDEDLIEGHEKHSPVRLILDR